MSDEYDDNPAATTTLAPAPEQEDPPAATTTLAPAPEQEDPPAATTTLALEGICPNQSHIGWPGSARS